MKSSMKFIGLFFVLALLIVSPVLAQESPNPLCNGLEAADCDLLTAPGEEAKSFSIPAWSIDFALNSAELGDIAFAASGSGQFMAPAEGSTEGLLVHLFIDEATMTSAGSTESGALEILVIGDMVYLQSEGQWYGGPIEEADLPVDPSTLSSGSFDMSTLSGDFSTSITTARGADADVSGASVAVFTTSVNLAQLIATVIAEPAVTAQIPPEQAESVQMIGMFVPMLLGNTTLTVEQSVGVDDGFIHKLVVAMPFDLDLSMLEMGQVTGSFDFSTEVADFNSTFEVAAPESYEPLDAMGSSMSMGAPGDASGEGAAVAQPENTILLTANADGTVSIEILSGEFNMGGWVAGVGTSLSVSAADIDNLTFEPGLGIQIGPGGLLLRGTTYEEGTLLIVDAAGNPAAQ